jgi:transcription antitermination factor NusB
MVRPRTFAREIAFQVLYRDDLNPQTPGPARFVGDLLLEQGRETRELTEFVRHLAELQEQEDSGPEFDPSLFSQWLRTPSLVEFTRSLLAGVREHLTSIDERIGRAAANWSLDRMAATDRNLLRLAAFEILHTETPGKVAIDEAIELAKRFGGAQSAQFVNGILDNLLHQVKREPPEKNVQ